MFYFIPFKSSLLIPALLLVLAIGAIGGSIMYYSKMTTRRKLAKSVLAMGSMKGKNYKQFTVALGQPASVEVKNGETGKYTLATWSGGGYTIMIRFDVNDIFVRIESEDLKE